MAEPAAALRKPTGAGDDPRALNAAGDRMTKLPSFGYSMRILNLAAAN
ncbi:MAG: hypothetical protein OJF48_002558 [Afipia sp.]|nr:MAG: hypothetical protein OJF48_002558 [Afipia sp.]